jgi:molybdate transport system substrate-binding protein
LKKTFIFVLNLFLLFCFSKPGFAEDKTLIFAASSTTKPLKEIISIFNKTNKNKAIASFASSSILAKQIENGAGADIFLSANPEWMDYLEKKNKINRTSRKNYLGNSLVLIAPLNSNLKFKLQKNFNFAGAFSGKLAMGDPRHVPAGIYGKQALESLGLWKGLETKVANTIDVQAALNLVEKKECQVGIVYLTDALNSSKVKIIATFPDLSHEPILYPVALIKDNKATATDFYKFLFSKQAGQVFTKYGFILKTK